MSAATAWLVDELAAAEAAIERVIHTELAAVPAPLAEVVRYALAGSGKRLRPILCVLAYRAAGGRADDTRIHDLAVALEIIHGYSLVHDDLPCMDDDDLRRGRATVHRAFDSASAAVAGAFLIPLAMRRLDSAAAALGIGPRRRRLLTDELARAAGAAGMVGGQWRDLDAEGRTLNRRGLEEVHRLKTGALIEAALAIGGIGAGAAPGVVHGLRQAGAALGLAFQIHDDVLDETASASTLGKTAGKDRASGKATFPALLGLDAARAEARAQADRAAAALHRVGIRDPALESAVAFAVDRDR